MNVVVIGDAGVGKSSLVSTFLSRQFSEVPGIMAKIRVPVEAAMSSPNHKDVSYSTTTIIDTQEEEMDKISKEGDMEVGESVENKICGIVAERIDAIVLVYSLNQIDTFFRLESYWLPLIEKVFTRTDDDSNDSSSVNIPPVIIAGNKMDLEDTDEQSQARSRHQIVSLLQQFKFVRQCIKCSAKNMWNVNDVFLKAQHAVLYPINPLYDLSEGKLSKVSELALEHVFRLFDTDRDNLLSDEEMKAFQRYCFTQTDRDLASWKKMLSKNNPNDAVLQDNKFTILGFLAMFDTYINSDRIEIPWIVLRSFGYDNNLQLTFDANAFSSSTTFSTSEIQFLISTFHQFNHDLSLIWDHKRATELIRDCYSQPLSLLESNLSLDQWMNQWYMLLAISPSVTRYELFCMGYEPNILRMSINKSTTTKPTKKSQVMDISSSFGDKHVPQQQMKHFSSKTIRIAVIGSSSCDETTLLFTIHDGTNDDSSTFEINKALTTCTMLDFKSMGSKNDSSTFIHYIFTSIPMEDASNQLSLMSSTYSPNNEQQTFDLILFLFDSSSLSSLEYVTNLETKYLNDDVPRVFVAIIKANEICSSTKAPSTDLHNVKENVLDKAIDHCTKLDLESPYVIQLTNNQSDKHQFLHYLGRFTLDPITNAHHLHVQPFAERKRRENAARRTIIWIGGFVAAAAVVVVSVVLFWNKSNENRNATRNSATNGIKVGK